MAEKFNATQHNSLLALKRAMVVCVKKLTIFITNTKLNKYSCRTITAKMVPYESTIRLT